MKAFIADRLFTGEQCLTDHAIMVEDGMIHSVIGVGDVPRNCQRIGLPGLALVPGFIDIQLYGRGERLLSVYPEPASLEVLVKENRKGGTVLCLPTVATNTYEVMLQCIDAVRSYWSAGGKGIHGLHLEGPWINPVKRGAHVESLIHSPTMKQVKELLGYGKGIIKMITLAPERVSDEVKQYIREEGILLSAGHSDATYEQGIDAFDNGIPAVTHLFNAMSPLHHRKPGLPGAAMDHHSVMASIIPDGIHVDYATLRIAKKMMGERLFVITDAVTETSSGPYRHRLDKDHYESDGILSGSALNMNKAVANLVRHAGIGEGEALRMCSLYPAKLLGITKQYGRIAPGYVASFIGLDENYEVMSIEEG